MQDRSTHILMQHYRNPVANRVLEHFTCEAERRNNLCGDEIHLQLSIDESGRISELGWQAKGCMLVKSSASILASTLKNQPVDEAIKFAGLVMTWLNNQEGTEKRITPDNLSGDLLAFEQMRDYPARIPCVKLAWQTFLDATARG